VEVITRASRQKKIRSSEFTSGCRNGREARWSLRSGACWRAPEALG